jgi:nucleoside-diphosphate-sugar epimerase
MNLRGQKFLVTGASGFIGSHLYRSLMEGGAAVEAISRTQRANPAEDLRWWQADLADSDAVQTLVAKLRPDVILHLASEVLGARDAANVLPTLRSNLLSTVNLLLAAKATGCRRVVLTGSLEEPDPGEAGAVPCSPYAAAKLAASAYGRMFHGLYDLDVVTLRLFMVYGPAQADARKLIPYVITSLLRGESPKLSSGQRPVDWIYVGDVVDAYLAAVQAPDVGGKTFEIGSGQLVTIRSLVEELAPMVAPDAKVQFGALPDRPLERVRVADTAAAAALGWEPRVGLEEGLRRTVEWYRGAGVANRLAAV